jgi:acyl carrier protein
LGLDTVELVMSVEGHFDITIPDHIAEKIVTVGDLHAYVVSELTRLGRDASPAVVFADLRYLIVDQLGVKVDEVVMDARFFQDLRAD